MKIVSEFQLEYTVVEGEALPCAAIIVAAGSGTRMGCNKQMVSLLGIPVIARTMLAFEQCKSIRDMILVAREEDIADIQALAETYAISKLKVIVPGGKERQDSVEKGVKELADDILYVAVHDGARPLITPELIDKVVADAKEKGAAALAVPVKNTIKRVVDGCIVETLQRDSLWAMQTPQVFDVNIYKKALVFAAEQNLAVTDDCKICEEAGYPVYITQGDYRNIKITTPEDLIFARALLTEGINHD